jgi:hypothetical protein
MVNIISSKYLEHNWIQTEGLSTDKNLRAIKMKFHSKKECRILSPKGIVINIASNKVFDGRAKIICPVKIFPQ